MKKRHSVPVIALLVSTLVVSMSGVASAKVLVNDPFNGKGPLGAPWKSVNAKWRKLDGALRVRPVSVDNFTKVGFAVRRLAKNHKKGLEVSSRMRFSPTRANVGIVAPYLDINNHLFCKAEDTPAHPNGLLAIGRRIGGNEPEVLVQEDKVGLSAGRIYRMVVTRHGRNMNCSLYKAANLLSSLDYRLKMRDVKAFGGGKRVGLRIRVVDKPPYRDEDDGRSNFENFIARTV